MKTARTTVPVLLRIHNYEGARSAERVDEKKKILVIDQVGKLRSIIGKPACEVIQEGV